MAALLETRLCPGHCSSETKTAVKIGSPGSHGKTLFCIARDRQRGLTMRSRLVQGIISDLTMWDNEVSVLELGLADE